jgi:hypothetical protein
VISVRQPIQGERAEDVALALGEALAQAIDQVGGEVVSALGERQ